MINCRTPLFFIIAIVFLITLLPYSVWVTPLLAVPTKPLFLTFDGDMNSAMKKEQESGLVKQWYDPELIIYLEKNKIPATFFLTGMFVEMYPDLVKTLASQSNFSIQNHSYSHLAFKSNCYRLPFITTDQAKKIEIKKAQLAIKSVIRKIPTYFRYPGLCHTVQDDVLVKEQGLSLVQGDFGSGDAWMKNTELIIKNVFKNLKEYNVIIFHLGNKFTPNTTDVVKKLLPKLKKLGYTFKHF